MPAWLWAMMVFWSFPFSNVYSCEWGHGDNVVIWPVQCPVPSGNTVGVSFLHLKKRTKSSFVMLITTGTKIFLWRNKALKTVMEVKELLRCFSYRSSSVHLSHEGQSSWHKYLECDKWCKVGAGFPLKGEGRAFLRQRRACLSDWAWRCSRQSWGGQEAFDLPLVKAGQLLSHLDMCAYVWVGTCV